MSTMCCFVAAQVMRILSIYSYQTGCNQTLRSRVGERGHQAKASVRSTREMQIYTEVILRADGITKCYQHVSVQMKYADFMSKVVCSRRTYD